MGCVDHHHIRPGVHQLRSPLKTVITHGRGRSNAQTPLRILAGIGVKLGLLYVFDCNKPDTPVLLIHDQQFLNSVLMQELFCFVLTYPLMNGHKILMGHQLAHGLFGITCKAHIAVGQNTNQFLGPGFHNRDTGDGMLLHQGQCVGQRVFRCNGDRIDHHAAFKLLNLTNLLRLLLRGHVAMKHAHTASLRHGNGQPTFGHGIHRRRNRGNTQTDRSCQAC